MRIRNVDFETILFYSFAGLVVVVLLLLVAFGLAVLAAYVYEQATIFSCIENGGIWLKNYQIGCTYPHG